ncbi:hypothetical protein PT974_10119 [Cladobotryum mycophilum]|uniref:UBZ4-type domain-containing protein n=1 Tax=Cladobotryum mycophilum TaxID=491253 RepID=A0ABR0S940_9HYPO
MNRPRNRQPRSERQNQRRGGNAFGSGGRAAGTPQQAAGTVPNSRQVVPGAGVFVVLKEDQSMGRETKGVVQDVLTSGDHPRGIKVRLRDGQVGRVQRLDDGTEPPGGSSNTPASSSSFAIKYTDIRRDLDYPDEPPPRSFADFIPNLDAPARSSPASGSYAVDVSQATAICPICEAFEGDEAAVTHHIDEAHLSGAAD